LARSERVRAHQDHRDAESSGGPSEGGVTTSALYVGRVAHRRFAPKDHQLTYPTFQLLLDLDETRALGRSLWLFSIGQFNMFSHHDRDHGDGCAVSLRAWVAAKLVESGVSAELGRIQLLAMPRMLGFVFNPVSLYYCHDVAGDLVAVIYEVHNTFGERHSYVQAALDSGSRRQRHARAKSFRVSPFMPMDLVYDFELHLPGEALRNTIDVRTKSGERLLTATFAGHRRPLNDRNLLAVFVQYPLLTLGVVAAIHWQALKLWLKGVPPSLDSLPAKMNKTTASIQRQAA
jgi:DUF1365 family protein